MTIACPKDILFDQLKDFRSATEQVDDTLPQLRGWASDVGLQDALSGFHTDQQSNLRDIFAIFRAHSKEPGNDECKAIAGLIEGGNNHIAAAADSVVRDHLLIAHTLRIAHYLLAAGRFTHAMATKCGMSREADRLVKALETEATFLAKLSEIAQTFGLELGGDS